MEDAKESAAGAPAFAAHSCTATFFQDILGRNLPAQGFRVQKVDSKRDFSRDSGNRLADRAPLSSWNPRALYADFELH